jgi:hypothetical protein
MLESELQFDIMLINRELNMKEDKQRREDYRPSFFKNHSDTLAIIGVNLAIAALLVTMFISNTNRIDAANIRSDNLSNNIITLIQEIKDMHGRICIIETKAGGK